MRWVAIVLLTLAASSAAETLSLRVHATPSRGSTGSCVFVIRAPLVRGGRTTTCLTRIVGFPGRNATMVSVGRLRFSLRAGSIDTQVRITQRFAADGIHARQTLKGRVVGGTGRYRRRRGTIVGSGTVIDRRRGLGLVDLRYTLTFR
jgi:hypothetical protein